MTTAERSNRTKIRDECIARSRGDCTVKTKTKTIIAKLDDETYKREPIKFAVTNNTLVVRTLIMGRYSMLQCAANFKGTYGGKNCKTCNVVDDESHRMNDCKMWERTNWYGKEENL